MPISKNKRKNSSKSGKNRTRLLEHKKVGKQLQPGFAQLSDKITFSSWSDERLPEMLWAAIIRTIIDQDYAISEFRRVISFVTNHKHKEKLHDLTLSGIAKLEESIKDEFIEFLLQNKETANALTVLRLFETLPARNSWLKFLPNTEPDLELLMRSVGMCLPHQSQEATDCRWLKVMVRVASGKFHVPDMMLKDWIGYPYAGDQRSIRPSIRACEMAQNPLVEHDLNWATDFWQDAWQNSPCLEIVLHNTQPLDDSICTKDELCIIRDKLEAHWSETHSTTAIDAKHDGIFGIAFYVLTILDELVQGENRNGILGRLALRTILECHINLRYLISEDNYELWKKWRTYGAGQAKLNALRFDELIEPPKFINTETIEAIASEDLWEEFINIELGSWSNLDLRKLSEKAKVKDKYDQFYSWTSGYSHGTWGPIREVCFETCGNPLHRLHRYPKKKVLPDTLYDACNLVNEVLNDLNAIYPGFTLRLLESKTVQF
ncbi:TPA: hypothetical protein JAJ28_004315 [Aeromonas hydrophila]|uniref:Uncharacterized protein n=1 Tax=Aeromonas hydrophila TaxID=644 RepID=A0AAD3YLW5_AERHY|nr:hypothetical protein [Aeromonas hydrophila]